MKAILALEDGRTFACRSFTGKGEVAAEVVFNTSMSGYQEVLTDPSYRGQMVTMTYPLIGNYGVNAEDVESDRVQVSAFLMREYQPAFSNYRADTSLADYLKACGVLGVDRLDTRALTRHIRTVGSMRAVLSTEDPDPVSLVEKARRSPSMTGRNLAREVTTKIPYRWTEGRPLALRPDTPLDNRLWRHRDRMPAVVTFDYGIKYNILRCLERVGFEVIVLPAATDASVVRQIAPDGIFLSNGPGDPEPVTDAVATIRDLLDYRPIFGICLGIQLLGLALGGNTYKLKFGHRGVNQPVKHLASGRVEITSQNHGFAVDIDSLGNKNVDITHINLNDDTLEGFRCLDRPVFAVQYHPEASPGPHDSHYLFDDFRNMMDGY